MPALPPPPSSSPPAPTPPGSPEKPAPAPVAAPAVVAPALPYDDLFGSEAAPPEVPPSLTFNVAAEMPPEPAAQRSGASVDIELPVPGIVVSDEKPGYVPPRRADEPPEPLLHSPVEPLTTPGAFAALPAPPPAPPATRIADLFDKVNAQVDAPPPPPAMWQASAVQSAKPEPVVLTNVSPDAPRPAPIPVTPAPASPAAASFRNIAPAPVRPRAGAGANTSTGTGTGTSTSIPSPSGFTPSSTPASRPMPLSDDDESDFVAPSAYDTEVMQPTEIMHRQTTGPDADTVIATAPPMRRAYGAQPSWRLVGLLVTVLLVLWIARLGAAPLFDVDEGAFSEATRELIVGHDWGSTTLNGVDRFDKPILVYWLQALSLKTFGVTEFAARLPSALCAFLWCLALGQFAWRRFGPQVAIAAAGILATSLGPMLIGRAATADSLLNLLLTLSTLDLWRHIETGSAVPRRRAFAWIGLGLLAKGPVAVLIPAAAAGLWLLAGRDRSRLQRLASDRWAWGLMVAIAAPWYAYALWRHGMAFVDGFLLHHNLERFTGSMEGHAGSLFYYVELLPALMMPWFPLLAPLLWHLRTRWKEPLGRFLLLWLGFVLAFFSLSGTKLPHYVLYGFTPLMLLAAQELVSARLWVRGALFVTIAASVVAGAASPWIASYAAVHTKDALYQALLSTAPTAPWVWLAVPISLLVFALTIWIPNVRNYLSEADGAVAAALLASAWLVVAVMPWWGQTLQDPIRTLARTLPIAQLNLQDHQRLVQWHLHQPSIAYYLGQTVERADPSGGDWALTRVDRMTPADKTRYEVVQQVRGYALVRPATAASEPLSRIGAANTAALAASEAAYAQAAAAAAADAARVAHEAASVAQQAAANARLAPAPPGAPATTASAIVRKTPRRPTPP